MTILRSRIGLLLGLCTIFNACKTPAASHSSAAAMAQCRVAATARSTIVAGPTSVVPNTRTLTYQLKTGGGMVEKKANFLGEGFVGTAYLTEDHQVLKVPHPIDVCKSLFDWEIDLFTTTRRKLADEPSDARFLAAFMVAAKLEEVIIDGVHTRVLVKDFASGTELQKIDHWPDQLNKHLDDLYRAYKAAYINGYEITDLNEGNLVYDDATDSLRIIDGLDTTNAPFHDSFSALCRRGDWCTSRYRQDPAAATLMQPGDTGANAERGDHADSPADGADSAGFKSSAGEDAAHGR